MNCSVCRWHFRNKRIEIRVRNLKEIKILILHTETFRFKSKKKKLFLPQILNSNFKFSCRTLYLKISFFAAAPCTKLTYFFSLVWSTFVVYHHNSQWQNDSNLYISLVFLLTFYGHLYVYYIMDILIILDRKALANFTHFLPIVG